MEKSARGQIKLKKMGNGLPAYFSHGGDSYDHTFQNVNLIKMPDSISTAGSGSAEQLMQAAEKAERPAARRIVYFPRKENTTIKIE